MIGVPLPLLLRPARTAHRSAAWRTALRCHDANGPCCLGYARINSWL